MYSSACHSKSLTFFSSAEHKWRYLEECSISPPKISFMLHRWTKVIQVCNNMRASKWWPNFHFWVNYPLKSVFHVTCFSIKQIFWFLLCCNLWAVVLWYNIQAVINLLSDCILQCMEYKTISQNFIIHYIF